MLKRIQDIEGIDPEVAKSLQKIGITTTHLMLLVAGTRTGRAYIEKKTTIDEEILLEIVNICDLYRISGMTSQHLQLLDSIGVKTIRELRSLKPGVLASSLTRANRNRLLCANVPGIHTVSKWVEQAKFIMPKVFH